MNQSEFIEKALGPEDLYTTAITLVSAEKIDEAIFEFENLLQWYPDYAIAHNDLGVLTYKCGHKDKALRHYEKAIQLQPQNVSFLMNLADLLYVEFDRIQDAILLYYRILSIAPENVETLMVLGQIHMDLGLIKEAKGIYEKVLALEPNNSVSLQLYQFLESFATIESIDNAPKWLASYRNEGGFFLISKPQRFAHNEKDYDKQHNITLNELKVGLGLVNLLNENKADSHGTALEIGCGTGLLSIGLAKYATYPKYVFTDPSPQFLQITNKKLKMTQINLATVHFAILKAEEIECLPCEEFSLIVMRSVLHHVLHVKKFIHDVAVCLRPGGIFTFQEPCMEGYVLMGALAQFIPLVIKTTGKILSNDQTKQVELFIKTMQFYARRDIDKSTAEDKHLFRVDELMKIGFEAGLDFEFRPNGTYEHFAASPQERNSHRSFYSFFL